MALVHSRLGRVFYCRADPVGGALGSLARIHTDTRLNHRPARPFQFLPLPLPPFLPSPLSFVIT